jgi:hypothetical protein
MCSNGGAAGPAGAVTAEIAARLASAIDECAAAAQRSGGAAEPDVSGRLAAMWALLTEADPELAALTARYTGS